MLESVEVPDLPEYMMPDRPPRVTVRFGRARASQSASSLRGPPSSHEAAPVLLPRIRSPTLVRFGRSNTAPVAALDGAPPPPPARLDKKSLSAPSSVASSSSLRSSSDADDDDDADFAAPPPARRPRLHGTEEVHSLVTAGNRIKFIDSVDFLLDGLRGGQPSSVRHSSALSLLDKCADADFVLDFVATDLVRGVLRLLQSSPDAVMDAATVAFVARVLTHKPAVEALASEYEFLRLLACWLDGADAASPPPAKHANSVRAPPRPRAPRSRVLAQLQVALAHAAVALSFGETAAVRAAPLSRLLECV